MPVLPRTADSSLRPLVRRLRSTDSGRGPVRCIDSLFCVAVDREALATDKDRRVRVDKTTHSGVLSLLQGDDSCFLSFSVEMPVGLPLIFLSPLTQVLPLHVEHLQRRRRPSELVTEVPHDMCFAFTDPQAP